MAQRGSAIRSRKVRRPNHQPLRDVIKVLGNAKRCGILREVARRPQSYRELAKRLKIPLESVRYHSDRLAGLGIIHIERSVSPHQCTLGSAVSRLAGPSEKVLTITARDGSTISFPISSL